MFSQIDELLKEVNSFSPKSKEELEAFRLKYLGKKGLLSSLFNGLKETAAQDKKSAGLSINNLKTLFRIK